MAMKRRASNPDVLETKKRKLGDEVEECACNILTLVEPRPHTLMLLPNELLLKLCLYLSTRDKMCLRLVNKRLYILLSDSIQWSHVFLEDVHHHRNGQYIRAALKLSQHVVKTLVIRGQLPFSQYELLITSCKFIERLSLQGFKITQAAATKITTSLSCLTHLALSIGVSDYNNIMACFSSLKKLVLILYQDPIEKVLCLWLKNCHPTCLVLVTNILHVTNKDISPSITYPADCVAYNKYRRPLDLPFYVQPFYYLHLNSSCVIINGNNEWPLIEIHDVITPQVQSDQCGMYGLVKSRYACSTNSNSYSQYGQSVEALYFTVENLPIDFLKETLQQTPHLVEISLSKAIAISDALNLIALLTQYCTKLRGLHIFCISQSSPDHSDNEHMWRLLSSINSLEYLSISCCIFLPPLDLSVTSSKTKKKIRTSHVPCIDSSVKDSLNSYMKRMTRLKALFALPCQSKCVVCTEHTKRSLINQNFLNFASNFFSLQYLKVVLPFAVPCLGMKDLLKNCNQLGILSINAYKLVLPVEPQLYCHLTHFCLTALDMSLSQEFINTLAPTDGSNKLVSLILFVKLLPYNGVLQLLTCSPNLIWCHIEVSSGTIPQSDKQSAYSLATQLKIQRFSFLYRLETSNLDFINTEFADLT